MGTPAGLQSHRVGLGLPPEGSAQILREPGLRKSSISLLEITNIAKVERLMILLFSRFRRGMVSNLKCQTPTKTFWGLYADGIEAGCSDIFTIALPCLLCSFLDAARPI